MVERGTAGDGRRFRWRRLGFALLVVLAAVAVLLGALYAFAGPERASEPDRAAYEQLVPPEAQAPEQATMPIPGCTCHSDDPKVRAEHSRYRIRDCGGCHQGGGPPF